MDKREFIKKASLVTVLASFGLTLESCSEEEMPTTGGGTSPSGRSQVTVDLSNSNFSKLKTSGEWVLHPTLDILLVNVSDTISAFSSVCTHSGCSRQWNFNGDFVCTCHNSMFNTSGAVTQGPATRPLTRIAVARDGDILTLG